MDKLKKYCESIIYDQNFDCLAVGVIDFKSGDYFSFQVTSNPLFENENLYFDLASMTKPLTFGVTYLIEKELFDEGMELLLQHRSGIPAWGRLSKDSWRNQILSYDIKESDTRYSDFGALRLQLEIEKKAGKHIYDICSPAWNKEIIHWLDLEDEVCPFTGLRNKKMISGQVHDDNAFVIGEKVAHAGLFGTVDGVCKTLLSLNKNLDLIKSIGVDHQGRYHKGWDTVEDIHDTLAGEGCSKNTFGHLGFTGTSMWIDPEKEKGHVILSNEVLGHWYDRKRLNALRKHLGHLSWAK